MARNEIRTLIETPWVGLSAAALAAAVLFAADTPRSYTTWSDYGGSSDSMQYSALKQANKSNVSHLELAWSCPVPAAAADSASTRSSWMA